MGGKSGWFAREELRFLSKELYSVRVIKHGRFVAEQREAEVQLLPVGEARNGGKVGFASKVALPTSD